MTDLAAIETLIAAAAAHLDTEEAISVDGVALGWGAVRQLQKMPSGTTLEAGRALCLSPDPIRRRVGAAFLGQLGHIEPGFEPVLMEERYQVLSTLLANEAAVHGDPKVLSDACFALGHLHDIRSITANAALRTHPDADVRLGVVSGLSRYEDDAAIAGLIELSADPDTAVRDWATFGLGQLVRADTPALRDALRARLSDPDPDTRNEAIAGLAARKDQDVLPVLIEELGRQVSSPLFEAAAELASPDLCDALEAARSRGLVWQTDGRTMDLEKCWADAMAACRCRPTPPPDSIS